MSNISELYPHNRKVFVEALNNLKTNKKLGIVQATGTGKGKLAACFVEHILKRKPSAKILIGAPFNSILQNYRDSFGMSSKDVKFVNYASLISLEEKDLLDIGLKYDLLILDEFHKLGAEERNKAINVIFEGVDNPKSICRVIGLTATPVRYLDNARDMGEELFGGNIIEGLSLEDAILDGILPGFIYNACYFGTESMLKEVEDKLKDNEYKISDDTIRNDLMVKVQELNMIYQNRLKIENIIKDNTCDLGANQKWVIFCRNKENLAEIREFCKSWFIAEPSIYAIHSDRQSVDNDRVLKEFREVKTGINVMLCVDMLNEGVHIKDLNGVIMLRKTDSPIIFLQQLGRALECGKEFQPIIFDLIGNYRGLKIEEGGLVRNPISIVKGIEEKVEKAAKPNYVIVHNFTEDFDSFMFELSKFDNSYSWSEYDKDILIKYYPIGGYKLCQEHGLYKDGQSIRSYAHKLGLKVPAVWTEQEDDILRKYYLEGGYKLCQENGLNKTQPSIAWRAKVLGLKGLKKWTDEEIAIFDKYYQKGGYKLCQEKGLNRTAQAISAHAKLVGKKMGIHTPWTPEEDAILRKYYPVGSYDLCIKKGLTNRTVKAMQARVKLLGIVNSNRWSDDELDILKRYYNIGGAELCIEKGLNRTMSAIDDKAKVEKVSEPQKLRWTKEEESIIYKYYPIGGVSLCKKMGLNRPNASIHQKVIRMGVTTGPIWSDTEIEVLRTYYPIGGSRLCREMGLDKNASSIRNKAKILNIKRIDS